MTTYKPQPGSLAALVCDWFSTHRDEELTTSDIGRKWSSVTVARDVHSKLAAAIKYGWLVRGPSSTGQIKAAVYTAGPNLPRTAAPTIQTVWARPASAKAPTALPTTTHRPVRPGPRAGMSSLIDTAMDAMHATLSAAPALAAQVTQERLRPLSATASSAIVSRPVTSQISVEPMAMANSPRVWETTIAVDMYARVPPGVVPRKAIDAVVTGVYERIISNNTLSGAVLGVIGASLTNYDMDAEAENTVSVSWVFTVRQLSTGYTFST